MKKLLVLSLALVITFSVAACKSPQKDEVIKEPLVLLDGTYKAESQDAKHGWKDYVVLTVANGAVTDALYESYNVDTNELKTVNEEYKTTMEAASGTYPALYMPAYATQFVETQDTTKVDVITGATDSHNNFVVLTEAALANAASGNEGTAIVIGAAN